MTANMPNDSDVIADQYAVHPYPEPIFNMDEQIDRHNYVQGSCPEKIWRKLFPDKSYNASLDVLIAGCGTNQAIYHALRFPDSRHFAIDVSDTSLNHVRAMIKKYNLKNLEVEKSDIYSLSPSQSFDYVVSTGVIHHTNDPQASLNRLVEVTRQTGALFIMVYANYLRHGVYYLQDAFRYLNVPSSSRGVALVRNLLNLLPADHYAFNYIRAAQNSNGTRDLDFDAGVIDTFLNARDVAFDIYSLSDLIKKSGSFFQCWLDNSFYYRDLINFDREEHLRQSYDNLNPWQLADFTQKICPNSGKFSFTLRKSPEYEHIWFNAEDLYANHFAYKNPRLSDRAPPIISENNGGSIGGLGSEISLALEDRFLWDSLGQEIAAVCTNTLEKYDSAGLRKQSEEDIKYRLHRLWKRGLVDFSLCS